MSDKRRMRKLVCNNCRKSKVKCSGEVPCARCIRSGIDLTCSTNPPSVGSKRPKFVEDHLPRFGSTPSPYVHDEHQERLAIERLIILSTQVRVGCTLRSFPSWSRFVLDT